MKNFLLSIKKMIEYFPIIYNNYDWDQFFLWSLLAYKLKRMHKYLSEDGIAVQEQEDLDALLEAIQIVEDLEGEVWEHKAFESYHEKYPYTLDDIELYVDEQGREVTRMKSLTEEQKKDFAIAEAQAEQNFSRLINRLSEILKNHSLHWWE